MYSTGGSPEAAAKVEQDLGIDSPEKARAFVFNCKMLEIGVVLGRQLQSKSGDPEADPTS